MIEITPSIRIHEDELDEHFIRAPGPGGQNVNKVASAVQLRFDAAQSPSLTLELRQRVIYLAGSRASNDGVIMIDAHRFRTRERNREDALERLVDLIRRAAHRPKPRKKTKPTRGSKERRLKAKSQRSGIKRLRGTVGRDE